MPEARRAQTDDLAGLLALFRASEVSAAAEPMERTERIWAEMLSRDGLTVFVVESDQKIVATCMLITAPNLLRSGRQHAFLENVVTHPDYRGRGFGCAVVLAALAFAWEQECHHVFLQSGRADPRVHRFYESCGFEPGIRTAYVAHRPGSSAR
jgi:ribosomal protein S18 acetylase RimI-like enzyme